MEINCKKTCGKCKGSSIHYNYIFHVESFLYILLLNILLEFQSFLVHHDDKIGGLVVLVSSLWRLGETFFIEKFCAMKKLRHSVHA